MTMTAVLLGGPNDLTRMAIANHVHVIECPIAVTTSMGSYGDARRPTVDTIFRTIRYVYSTRLRSTDTHIYEYEPTW